MGKAIARKSKKTVAQGALRDPITKQCIVKMLGKELRQEVKTMSSQGANSILKSPNAEHLKDLLGTMIFSELSKFAPLLKTQCSRDEFGCSNGNCVPLSSQCNRYNDCADNSDEVGCVCYATTAIQWSDVAGGCTGLETTLYYSCPICTDNVKCTCNSTYPAAVVCSNPYCPSTNFKCNNGLCIDTAYVCDGYNDCRDNSDERNCLCTRGMVHLEGGATAAQGTVAVCFRNRWGAVCDTYWTAAEAKVVCRQLGYTGKENGFHMDRVGGCRGNESTLAACAYTIPLSTCYNNNRAGVSCYNSASISSSVAAAIISCTKEHTLPWNLGLISNTVSSQSPWPHVPVLLFSYMHFLA
ncbi:hypothetical protein EMCRGX_G001986 [Ephydatia muelleri]